MKIIKLLAVLLLSASSLAHGAFGGTPPLPTLTGTPSAGCLSYWDSTPSPYGQSLFCPTSSLMLNQAGSAPINYPGSTVTTGRMPQTLSASGDLTGTSTPTFGASGTLGTLTFGNATSGTLLLTPPTGALGTITTTLPNASSTLPIFGQQITFTGPTAARSIALPDASFTVARTDAANTFTGDQTMSANVFANSFTPGYATTATAAGTTTLTASSAEIQVFTGSSSQTVVLPVTSTLTLGKRFRIINNSTGGDITVQSSGANTIFAVARNGTSADYYVILTSGTSAASWTFTPSITTNGSGSGTSLTINSGRLTFTGTSGATYTLPGSTGTLAALGIAQAFTNLQTFASTGPVTLAASSTAPTIASGLCTSPTVSASNGTAAFALTIGTSCSGIQTGTLTMPAATTGWVCSFANVTTPASFAPSQTGGSTTTVTFTNYSRTTGLAADFTASESLRVRCTGY